MKILVTQLARFGDIFQTWPVVNSLKRNYPDAQIHFMCRKSFAEAAKHLNTLDHLWVFDVASQVVKSIASDGNYDFISEELAPLQNEKFDQIINLTFSPLSSYITDFISTNETSISGYTRHEDGYLSIPDDPSALIYGQLGVEKYNRIHLTRLFSAVAGIDLIESDWKVSNDLLAYGAIKFTNLPDKYIAIHIGGSTNNKLLSSEQWSNVIEQLFVEDKNIEVILLGNNGERGFSEEINVKSNDRLHNFVGQTQLVDLFYLIQKSELIVAPDSSLVHMSSLVNKRCLNLSFSCVNFWETGPLAKGSYVMWAKDSFSIDTNLIADSIKKIRKNVELAEPFIKLKEGSSVEAYSLNGYASNDFQWKLIQAIYLGEDFPILDDLKVFTALKQLAELTDMALRDLEMVRDRNFQNVSLEIVNNVEQLIVTLEKLVPEVRPIIWWFNTERLRIGPLEDEVIFDKNYNVFTQLRSILSVYVGTNLLSPQINNESP